MDKTFLGIDLGTSGLKLVLIDSHKNVLKQVSREYAADQPQTGWSEIDPEVWYDNMVSGIRELLKDNDPGKIRTIGVTGQMHTLVVLNQEGSPVRPAMMWNDIRTRDIIPHLKEKFQNFEEGEYLSKTVSTGSPAANLYWLKVNEPERFEKISKFLIGPDYLVYKLTGNFSTDYCEASTSCLFQIQKGKWSEEVRKFLGIQKELYPELHGSASLVGKLKSELVVEFGMEAEVDVIAGTGDNPATAVSTGCLGKGYPVISLGTSGVLMMPVEDPGELSKGKVIMFSFDGKSVSYLVQGVVQSNGQTMDWWTRRIMELTEYDELADRIDLKKASETPLLFYPHIVGDKTLYADPDLKGAFLNLSAETGKEDMFYAVVEGLCFAFRELAEKMHLPFRNFKNIKVVGGGSRSRIWMRTLANVLNFPVAKMDGMIGPAFGIALLAAYESGCISSLSDIVEGCIKVERIYDPDMEIALNLEKKYEKYLRIHDAVKFIETGKACVIQGQQK